MDSFELAFRMQAGTQIGDLSERVSRNALKAYGVDNKPTDKNARCLLARRCAGGSSVRAVSIGGWDHHGNIRNEL